MKRRQFFPGAGLLAVLLLVIISGVLSGCGASSRGPQDGSYRIGVTLSGGSGKATVSSPALLRIEGGEMTAALVWSSDKYDYMLVDDVRYEAVIKDGHSVFEIPVAALDKDLTVIADTVAMSTPHEITYTLRFDSATMEKVTEDGKPQTGESAESASPGAAQAAPADGHAQDMKALGEGHEIPLAYAQQFTLTEYEGGFVLLDIETSGRFLMIPEGASAPDGIPEDIVLLPQPVNGIYLAATSAMDFFRTLDGIGNIRLSGTDRDGWTIPEAREAMESGSILFAGKYSAPDYERIHAEGCGLAIESTMIYHKPEVKEQLERLGVPVLVERSSYEEDPLGRMEWIKVYGALLGKTAEAEEIFRAETEEAENIRTEEPCGNTVAFFYITSSGTVNVRRSDDYVPKMIAMAGGSYIFPDLTGSGSASTVNMTMESFYSGAKDADILIYNSSIDGELWTMAELLAKEPLLAGFKAVKAGDVYCTGKNLFQEPMGLGKLILDMHRVLTGDVPSSGKLTYLHRLDAE